MSQTLDEPSVEPLATLLRLGADHRGQPDEGGRDRYGGLVWPEPGLTPLGACTASAADPIWWPQLTAHAPRLWAMSDEALHQEADHVRQALQSWALSADAQLALCMSGTDAEYVAAWLCPGDEPLTLVIAGAQEAGHGTILAATGRHFGPLTPSGQPAIPASALGGADGPPVDVHDAPLRDAHGAPRQAHEVMDELERATRQALAQGRRVLVHAVASSKTGLHACDPARLADLLQASDKRAGPAPGRGPGVSVVVDAAQGRVWPEQVRAWLEAGAMVLLTGSKLFGAPPFAGALLVPPGPLTARAQLAPLPEGLAAWLPHPAMLPQAWSVARAQLASHGQRQASQDALRGLLTRWHVGLNMMTRWQALGHARQLATLQAFALATRARCDAWPLRLAQPWPSQESIGGSIASFWIAQADGQPLGLQDLRRRRAALAQRGVSLGQALQPPGSPPLLRVALGVPLALRMAQAATTHDPGGQRWLEGTLKDALSALVLMG